MATQAESDHMRDSKLYVGCLACLVSGWPNAHSDYHHVVEGRKRLGHYFGFPLCLWHHRSERNTRWQNVPMAEIESRIGPPLAGNSRRFAEVYGSQLMLAKLNDFALSLWHRKPWLEHCMPADEQRTIRAEHRKLLSEQ